MPTVLSPDDPRRPDKVRRYKPLQQTDSTNISEHVNALGMVFSLVGLLLKVSRSCVHVTSLWKFSFADEVGSMGGRLLYTHLRSKWQGCGRQETDNQFIHVSYSIKIWSVVTYCVSSDTKCVCGYKPCFTHWPSVMQAGNVFSSDGLHAEPLSHLFCTQLATVSYSRQFFISYTPCIDTVNKSLMTILI